MSAVKREKAMRLVREGLSFGEAAARCGMTRNAVAGLCYRNGVKAKPSIAKMRRIAKARSERVQRFWGAKSEAERRAHGRLISAGIA